MFTYLDVLSRACLTRYFKASVVVNYPCEPDLGSVASRAERISPWLEA